jgi:hypothetical protein
VAISANDGESGLSDAELGTNNVDDALIRTVHVKEAHSRFAAIRGERVKLSGGIGVYDRQKAIFGNGWDGMIHHGEGQIWPADFAACGFQAGKCLRAGAFVNQVTINIKKAGLSGGLVHNVRVPNLLIHRAQWHIREAPLRF